MWEQGPDLCDLSPARVEAGQHRVLDEATRQRRLSRQLEALEKDNFQVCVCVGGGSARWCVDPLLCLQDDPLSSLPPPGPTTRLPAFSETEEPGKIQENSCFLLIFLFSFLTLCLVSEKKKRKTRGDHFKQRFRKNFTALLEEEVGLVFLTFWPLNFACLLGQLTLHSAPLLTEPVWATWAKLPVCSSPAFTSPPTLLLCLWLPFTLHLHYLRGALLQQQVSLHTQRDQVLALS